MMQRQPVEVEDGEGLSWNWGPSTCSVWQLLSVSCWWLLVLILSERRGLADGIGSVVL